jgi:SAM-dependent methyltransferase
MDRRPEFDRYATRYGALLDDALLPTGVDSDRFAAYKIEEVAHVLAGRNIERILDFGCGPGRSMPHFRRAFPEAELFGFDPSPECAAAARAQYSDVVVTSDWHSLPKDGFDCVVAANVFHHVPPAERRAAMERCARALGSQGSLFVFEHNPLNPLTRWVFNRCPFDCDAVMLGRAETLKLGRDAGLEVVAARYTLFVPWAGKVWAALQRSLGWCPAGAQYYVRFTRRLSNSRPPASELAD